MQRTARFVKAVGMCVYTLENGEPIRLPIVPGLFKHAPVEALDDLPGIRMSRPYTLEALRVTPWQVVRQFPRDWLLACICDADLPEGRRMALELMLAH